MKYTPKELISWMIEEKMIPHMTNAVMNNDVGFSHLCVKPILIKNDNMCYTVIETTGDTIELPDMSVENYLNIMDNKDKTLECIIRYNGETYVRFRIFDEVIDNDKPESIHLVMRTIIEYFLEATGMNTRGKVRCFIKRCAIDMPKDMPEDEFSNNVKMQPRKALLDGVVTKSPKPLSRKE